MSPNDGERVIDRRRYIQILGGTGLSLGLAGCTGNGGDGGDGDDGADGGDGDDGDDGSDGSDGDSGDAVVLGQPAALTGKWDFLQKAANAMTEMSVSEINDAGGPLDRELTVNRRDTGVDPQEARTVVQQLTDVDNASAIAGLFSSEIVPLQDFLIDNEVPVVTPWPGSRDLDTFGGDKGTPDDVSDDEWVWRTIISDSVHTAGSALKMAEEVDTVAVLNGTSAGERSWAEAFMDAAAVIDGVEVVTQLEVEEGKNSYQSDLSRLFDNEFDGWAFSLGLQDAITLMREWGQGGYGKPLMIEDGLQQSELVNTLGSLLEGQDVWLTAGSTSGPASEGVLDQFTEEYPDQDTHPWGIAMYDAVNVAALAIHRAGSTDPIEVQKNIGPVARPPGTEVTTFAEGKEALDSGDEINFQGAVSSVDFTEHGDVVGNASVYAVNPDGFEETETVDSSDIETILTDEDYGA